MKFTVKQFRDHCKAFDETASSEAARDLGSAVEEQLPTTYQIPYEETPSAASPLQAVKARHYRGLWHELVQHLTDLGYLTEHDFSTYHRLRKALPDDPSVLLPTLLAVRQYLQEEDWPELKEMFTGDPGKLVLAQLEEHLGAISERISRYTSFDGSLAPPEDYEIGAVNCYGRSLAFRIRTFYAVDPNLKNVFIFKQQHLGFLYNFQSLIQLDFLPVPVNLDKLRLPDECWQMLCNVDLLFDRFKKARPEGIRKKKIVLVYGLKVEDSADAELDSAMDDEETVRQRKRKLRRMSRASKKLAYTGYHSLGIRILQVKLWQTHFYTGEVDGIWNWDAHHAVMDLIAQEKELLPKKKNGKFKVAPLRKLNAIFTELPNADNNFDKTYALALAQVYDLLRNYHSEDTNSTGSKTEKEDEMIKLLNELQKKHGVDNETIDQRVLESDELKNLYPDPNSKPRRRVAFPRKSFLKGIWRGIKWVVNWLKQGIKKLLGPVFGFVKLLLNKVRAGIQQFFRGFRYLAHFLLGRPIVTYGTSTPDNDSVDVFATQFNLDFDGVNYISDQANATDIERHAAHLHDMKESMFYFIDTTLKIIKMIGKLATPGGWIWLGWQIARMVVGELVDLVSPVA